MPAIKRDKYAVSDQFLAHMTTATRELGIAEGCFEQQIQAFLKRCKGERTDARRAAVAAARSADEAQTGRIPASPYILTYRLRHSLELYWVKITYDRDGNKRYQRVSARSALGPDMRTILAKALPEEVEVIRRHESEARTIRALWSAYARQRRGMNGLVDSLVANGNHID